jgi:uncharacterized protein YbjT (DUF2867 family)
MVLPEQTVTVIGCSGKQGYGVADALLQSQKFKVRGVSRDQSKERCKTLSQRGVQVVQADLNHAATLKPAFEGVQTAFLMTDFYDNTSHISETEQGLNEVEAALNCGVRNIVFSSLVDAERISNGRYKVEHFTGKHKVEDRIRELRQQNRLDSAVFVLPGFYWQNLAHMIKPQRQQDGSFVYLYPTDPAKTPVCSLDISDFGPIVAKILENPKQYDGRSICISSECLTLAQMASMMGEAIGKKVIAKEVSEQEALRNGISPEFIEMYRFFRDFGYYGGEQISPLARQLNPNMKDFRTFLRTNQEWRALFN